MSIKSNRAFVIAAALVSGVTGIVSAPAFAEEVRTVTVDYKDLDLASQAGQKALARRVSTASQMVCTEQGNDLGTIMRVNACKTAAKTRAAADLAKNGVPAA